MRPLITLTTDFGYRDPYVAAMKGALISHCHTAEIIDLSHSISHGNILEGSLFVASTIPSFPKRTIHVVVVDPGVGTERAPVLVQIGGRLFVGPDNGLLTVLMRRMSVEAIRTITNPMFMNKRVSPTFHGRDIFAPAAGRIAGGANPVDVGPAQRSLVELDIPRPRVEPVNRVIGEIIHIDHFGNAITNIPRDMINEKRTVRISVKSLVVENLSTTYGQHEAGTPVALIGSTDHLEVAVTNGNGAEVLGLAIGDEVEIEES